MRNRITLGGTVGLRPCGRHTFKFGIVVHKECIGGELGISKRSGADKMNVVGYAKAFRVTSFLKTDSCDAFKSIQIHETKHLPNKQSAGKCSGDILETTHVGDATVLPDIKTVSICWILAGDGPKLEPTPCLLRAVRTSIDP
jgi:hypothetical protein